MYASVAPSEELGRPRADGTFLLNSIKQADGSDKISGRGLKIIGQRLKFDNHLVNVCETLIEQILFIATICQILLSKCLKFLHLLFICN